MSEQESDVQVQPVYVAFQGGGAKGAIHIGALRALESNIVAENSLGKTLKAKIVGVAGTSAGSIMAALVACKYEANELFKNDSELVFLEKMMGGGKGSLTSMFTWRGWLKISLARFLSKLSAVALCIISVLCSLVILLLASPQIFSSSYGAIYDTALLTSSYVAVACIFFVWIAIYFFRPGLAPLKEVRSAINRALSGSDIFKGKPPSDVTFRQLEVAGGRPLKIVSTNLTTKGIQVFSARSTPDVSIADAVCASICLPYIFKPYEVALDHDRKCKFVDGGLLSNLPLWVFDEERRVDDSGSWTIGFSIVGETSEKSHWLGAILDAVVAGPPEIHARGIDNLMVVPLSTSLGMLDFGAPLKDFKKEIDCVEKVASNIIVSRLDEWHVEGVLARLGDSLVDSFKRELKRCGIGKKISLKLAIACPGNNGNGGMVTRFRSGYQFYDIRERAVGNDSSPIIDFSLKRKKNDIRLSSSIWIVALPLKTTAGRVVPSVILIESPDLTSSDVCRIYDCESKEAFGQLAETLSDAVDQMDFEAEVGSIVFPETNNGT
ncbi:patatin-like phospholipase family protein [Xanthomonas hortorum pv. gardneri]|uniref:patatin-like phospholipase family protein n=1 Tax=Xanthomonas hortorum TaxID=56454 RepID=UPI001E4CAF18|nr:patatin-like phospholipase family protein [Xanthomonas hortorum]MCC8496240.1 patatin-like phospholipase family protein [Xanthomonas hortorum pv. gardneri]MCE4530018.1 patatin-like phospholipase family protein [Xanthomonas hortorum pv. vitians]